MTGIRNINGVWFAYCEPCQWEKHGGNINTATKYKDQHDKEKHG